MSWDGVQYDEIVLLQASLDPELGATVRGRVLPGWFGDERNRLICEAIRAEDAERPVSFLGVMARLQSTGLSAVLPYAADILLDSILLPSDVHRALQAAEDRQAQAVMLGIGAQVEIWKAQNPDASAAELRQFIDGRLSAAGDGGAPRAIDLMARVDAVAAQMHAMEEAQRSPWAEMPGLWFGIPSLDRDLGGLLGGQVCVIAARPGVGKTSLAVQFAMTQAGRSKSVLFVSYEMAADELVERAIVHAFPPVAENRPTAECIDRGVLHLRRSVSGGVQFIDDNSFDLTRIRAYARQMKAGSGGLDCIIIDYVQLVPVVGQRRVENRQQEMTAISASIKGLAKELDIPILALSQFNRAAAEGEPQMHQLRESGSLEQDADKVILLWEPDAARTYPRRVTAKIAKNRQGGRGRVSLDFAPDRFTFTGALDE